MNLKLQPSFTFVGSLVGLAISLVLFLVWELNVISAGIVGGLVLIGYIIAAVVVEAKIRGTTGKAGRFSEFLRGLLIGLNAGLNYYLAFWIVSFFSPMGSAIAVGACVGLLNFLCSVKMLSQSEVYQGIVGWVNWFLPMSWPIIVFGFLFLLVNLLLALVTFFQVNFLKIKDGAVDWRTGTFFIQGGLISNLNAWDTAFNMGNFSFADMNSSSFNNGGSSKQRLMNHEAGHTLNLAAFGSAFHLIGFINEMIRHHRAYAELLAESNTSSDREKLLMWA